MNKKKNKEDIENLIRKDEDFIYCPRLGNSLKKLIEKNPDGIDDERIAKVLLMSKEDVENLFNSAVKKMRKSIDLE